MSLRHISKDYSNGGKIVRVLNSVSLEIFKNEFLVILGESGSGKSTLLNIIGCMIRPTEGTILVDGKDFSHPSEDEMTEYRRSSIGFVFQAYNLMPTLTALENIRFITETSDNPMKEEEALAMVGLSDRADHFPSALSGGEQQRVAIARAIAKSPRMILADEPTAALDADTGREVLAILQKAVKERGTTLIMVTHNAEIARMANRVIHVRNGRIADVHMNPIPLQASELSW
ncbi:MAG: ABC transporter ATP-binding protein [Oscillospiraceae bacterium]|nr:ABC transporter ATP-binding protein [Oscillospiraceae bacterium]